MANKKNFNTKNKKNTSRKNKVSIGGNFSHDKNKQNNNEITTNVNDCICNEIDLNVKFNNNVNKSYDNNSTLNEITNKNSKDSCDILNDNSINEETKNSEERLYDEYQQYKKSLLISCENVVDDKLQYKINLLASLKKKESKPQKKWKNVLKYFSICFYSIFVILIAIIIINYATHGSASLFGYKFYYILTDSMTPELEIGDVIRSKVVESESDLKEGQYVTFIDASGRINTHKLVRIFVEPSSSQKMIQTIGLKSGATLDEPVPISNVKAYYIEKVEFLTFIFKIVKTTVGFAFLVIIPLLSVLLLQLYKIAKVVTIKSLEDEIEKQKNKLSGE